jgi:trimeric autotransporter adhesin
MAINGVDPSAKTPARIRRDWSRVTKGSVTATIQTFLPVTIDGSNRVTLNIATNGGLTATGNALAVKLDTNPGLVTASTGLKILLATGAPLTLTSGLNVAVDNATIAIMSSQLIVKDGAIAGAKFGWASAKGDLLVYNGTAYVALPVGTNGQVLTADSTQTTGLKWV